MMGWLQIAGVAFSALGSGTKLAMAGALIAALGIGYGVWHHKVWERGYARAIADIAEQDNRAIQRATTARNAVLDCRARGLRWDQSTGACAR